MRLLASLSCACLVAAVACGAQNAAPKIAPVAPAAPAPAATGTVAYPPSPRDDVTETLHGIVVRDPYRWLERADDPKVQQWVEAENALSRKVFDGIPARNQIKERLTKLLYSGRLEAPKRAGGRDFYLTQKPGNEKAVLFVRERGSERTLVDPNKWPATDARALSRFWPSRDGRKVLLETSVNNADRSALQVLDVEAGTTSDVIDGLYDEFPSWSASGDGFYYRWSPSGTSIALPDLPAHAETRFHRLGSPSEGDRTIRGPTDDPGVAEYVSVQGDGNWLVAQIEHGFSRQDVLVYDLRATTSGWNTILAAKDVWGQAVEFRDVLYLRSTEGAPRGRVFSVDLRHPDRGRWKEIIPQREDAALVEIRVVAGRLVLRWNKDDASELETSALDGTDRKRVTLPSLGDVERITGGTGDDRFFATFESYTFPTEVLEVDPASGAASVWDRVASPINPDDYTTESRLYTSHDGTRVPMFLVYRRGMTPSGAAPTFYWGYGGFGIPVRLKFRSEIFAWLDSGGVYAEAGIRGGGDYGEEWHRAGMRALRRNSIDDYLAGAEALASWGWTRADRLMAAGASNGGLLVGAAITKRPDLFGAAFIWAPILDMVRYPLFGSGKSYLDEFGSPDEPGDLGALLSYSPYHNVQDGVRYPAVFVYTADSDDRVDPVHARKFVAALQTASSGGPVLLTVAKKGGHGGPDGIEPRVARYADAYAFGLHAMGLDSLATTAGP